MKIYKSCVAALVLGVGLSGAAQAALYDRGGGLIYDDVLNITWLQDANYAKTSGYSATGQMTWNQATSWAANLSYYDSVRNVTLTGWRLPIGDPTCSNYCGAGTEMGYLFYSDLGGVAGENLLFTHNANYNLFTNIGGNIYQVPYYWSGTLAPAFTGEASYFVMRYGNQGNLPLSNTLYAWAVRPGDVAAVPEADTWAMLLAGLGLIGAVARRRRQFEV
jgi:MYXO-CTERM domain-containing protein